MSFSQFAPLLVVLVAFLIVNQMTGHTTDVGDIRARIRKAVAFIRSQQLPDGSFVYLVDHDTLASVGDDDNNIVRQAGTIYCLAEYEDTFRDASIHSIIDKSLEYMQGLSINRAMGGLLVCSPYRNKSSLGASALTLMGELLHYHGTGCEKYREFGDELLQGILAQRIEHKGFAKAPGSMGESPYYNGECYLALAYYQLLFGGLDSHLSSLDTYFVQLPFDKGFYQWYMMALDYRLQAGIDDPDRYLAVMKTQTQDVDGSHCSKMEGVWVVLKWVQDPDISKKAHEEFQDLLKLQISQGGFKARPASDTLRIDYTQHCLSMLIKYFLYVS